jgi:hypothetical protein
VEPRRRAAILALACAAVVAGCGAGDQASTVPGPETADPRPPLPSGWRRVVNARAGFSIGMPRSWVVRTGQALTVARSPDREASIAISADRSADGQSTDVLENYARRTAVALRGHYRNLRVDEPRRVRGTRYPTSTARATGTFRGTTVRQEIVVTIIRRPGRVTFSLIFFRNAVAPAARYAGVVTRMIRSFRSQPPQY